jgi:hypothetical protein
VASVPVTTSKWIAQQLVGILDSQEAGAVGVRRVGMEALGEASMCSADLDARRVPIKPQHAVGIRHALHRRHV